MVLGRFPYKTFFLAAFLTAVLAESAFAQTYSTVQSAQSGPTLGTLINNVLASWSGFAHLLSMFAYVFGSFLGVSSVLKFKQHVDNPQQTTMGGPVGRMLGGGMMLSLPWMMESARSFIFGTAAAGSNQFHVGGFTSATLSDGGLDKMVVDLITNVAGPMEHLLTAVSYLCGYGLLIVGIVRLTKLMEEGPRAPSGFGTVMTFIAAGALVSFGDSMGSFVSTMFGDSTLMTKATIGGNIIADSTDSARIEKVIEAVMVFVTIVGYIAFIRGWFVLKNFADGGQQNVSLAQGLTFLLGGTMAINLGALVNALQNTVNVQGITFGMT